MKMKLAISMALISNLSACSSMTWHEGSMIQYQNIKSLPESQFSIEVLGGWKHDQQALERAVIKESKKLCKSEVKLVSSQMGTYYSSVSGGGITTSGNPPKIVSIIQCDKAR